MLHKGEVVHVLN